MRNTIQTTAENNIASRQFLFIGDLLHSEYGYVSLPPEINPSTPRSEARGMPFDRLKAPSEIEGLRG